MALWPGGESDSEFLGAGQIGLKLLLAQAGVERSEKHQGGAGLVVDSLGVDVLGRETDAQTGTGGRSGDFLADAPATFLQQRSFADSVHVLEI